MTTIIDKKSVLASIKSAGLSVQQAAEKLGMSRQNLYKHLSQEPLSSHFVRQFNEVFEHEEVTLVKEKGVPYYQFDASASQVDAMNDHKELSSLIVVIPGFEDCDMALPVFGHSMYPTFENGCIILCKRIHDLDVIQYGEVYLIVTQEQRLLKRVKKSTEKGSLLLVSDNYEAQKENKLRYEPFDLHKNKIRYMYIVKGSIKRNQI